jgi:hypothetical protein
MQAHTADSLRAFSAVTFDVEARADVKSSVNTTCARFSSVYIVLVSMSLFGNKFWKKPM